MEGMFLIVLGGKGGDDNNDNDEKKYTATKDEGVGSGSSQFDAILSSFALREEGKSQNFKNLNHWSG
jgi:hypothetical protein